MHFFCVFSIVTMAIDVSVQGLVEEKLCVIMKSFNKYQYKCIFAGNK